MADRDNAIKNAKNEIQDLLDAPLNTLMWVYLKKSVDEHLRLEIAKIFGIRKPKRAEVDIGYIPRPYVAHLMIARLPHRYALKTSRQRRLGVPRPPCHVSSRIYIFPLELRCQHYILDKYAR